MKKLYLTFQPNTVIKTLEKDITYQPDKNYYSNYDQFERNPIFCKEIKPTQDLIKELLLVFPSFPQGLIIFEKEQSEVTVIDYIKWAQAIAHPDKKI